MDAQVCEYTINHWIMHFKKVNCVECEFDLSKAVFFFFNGCARPPHPLNGSSWSSEKDVSVCARVLDTESHYLPQTGRLRHGPSCRWNRFLPSLLLWLGTPRRESWGVTLPSGKDKRRFWASSMSAPELRRQEASPLRVTDQEGPDPARHSFASQYCLSPHSGSLGARREAS